MSWGDGWLGGRDHSRPYLITYRLLYSTCMLHSTMLDRLGRGTGLIP